MTDSSLSNETLGRFCGKLDARLGSDSEDTLSETISWTRPAIPGEWSKQERTPPASETHFLISPNSLIHGMCSRHGENKEWKRSAVRMLLLHTVLGTIFALGHHYLYETLSNPPTLAVSIQIGSITVGPMWALTVGNGLSWLVQLSFTLAIGGALVQRFWHLVHNNQFTLHEMDHVFSITSAFYTRTALRRATGFTMVAVLFLILGGIISTFAPASLSISVLLLSQPCDIMTVDFSNARTFFPSTELSNLAAHVLLAQSAVPPASSPCSNCTYNVTYFAPALTCKEVDVDASPFDTDSVDTIMLWNGTFTSNPVSRTVDIYVLSRTGNPFSGGFSDPQIIMCTLQNATYQAEVDHRNGTSVTAEMNILPFSDQNPESVNITSAYLDIGQAFGQLLSGYIELVPKGNSFRLPGQYTMSSNTFVIYTGWVTCGDHSTIGPCTRNIDLLTALPLLMQHMSVSLLAGSVTIDNTTSSLSRVPEGHCLNESAVYVYDRVRLLAVYGSALLVTSICVVMGIHTVVAGQGSTLTFSNLVYAIMSPEMMEISNGQELPQDTVIHAERGRFVPGQIV
ncbi:hypothetical protein BD410DRAFT_902463 [Rickenella mellea]|uniref:Transmembrane protein n=1 Tax=Rickenella mellea TaxID=50990 RepID=A0A4Y7PKD3_9AGAM|nr:hypothetical protein BD410DRAFT_902463 [Rickenella mellea]